MILNYLRFPGDGIDVIQATLDWDTPLEPEPFEAVGLRNRCRCR